jgi:hypothetical protein
MLRWIFRNVPGPAKLYRWSLFWQVCLRIVDIEMIDIDPHRILQGELLYWIIFASKSLNPLLAWVSGLLTLLSF